MIGLFFLMNLVFQVLCQHSNWETERKPFLSLEIKYQKLVEKAGKTTLIQLRNRSDLQDFVINTPRNYSAIILVISESEYENCKLALSALRSVTLSYVIQFPQNPDIFFFEIDYESAGVIFKSVSNKGIYVPSIFYVPSSGKLNNVKRMNTALYKYEYNYQNIVHWIKSVSGISIRHLTKDRRNDSDSDNGTAMTLLTVSMCLYMLFKSRDHFTKLFEPGADRSQHAIWILIVLILMFTSGQIFNHIENVPFTVMSKSGEWYFVYPSTRTQLVIESLIIFALSGGNIIGMIMMLQNGDKITTSANQTLVFVGLGLFTLTFFVIQSMSQLKMRG